MSTVSADRLRWIGVDWGTTRVRAWAMGEGDAPLEAVVADAGMGTLRPEDFEPTLLGLVAPWLGHDAAAVPTLVCGMAGARQGWREAPYAEVPGAPLAVGSVVRPPLRDRRLSVAILPGLAQRDPPDVMRGEETQIAGALASGADPDGVLCLPGTHTKWARLEGGRVAAFATAMTGELFAALARHSVLRHSLEDDAWHPPSFARAVRSALDRPEALLASLFAVRAGSLLDTRPPGAGRAMLSGLLIGADLAASRPWWQARRPTLVGAGELVGRYAAALAVGGAEVDVLDGEDAVRAGLLLAHRTLSERTT